MNEHVFDLASFSESILNLVDQTASGVAAVKAGAYRSASGVCIAPDLIAVADSSIRREERIAVYAADGKQGAGTLLGRERRLQLAFLKVDGLELRPLAGSDAASWKAGMLAAVVGLTADAGPSVSLGVLGAVAGPRRTWRGGMLDRFVRLDANVFPSQSGAAVVDAKGRLIGMATPGLMQYSTVALPLETLNRVAAEILAQGRIRHGYMGVGVQPVAMRGAQGEAAGQQSGLILLSVEPESPAEKAGLQVGDVLLSLDGKPLTDVEQLQDALTGDVVGRQVQVGLLRGGEKQLQGVTVVERERKGR